MSIFCTREKCRANVSGFFGYSTSIIKLKKIVGPMYHVRPIYDVDLKNWENIIELMYYVRLIFDVDYYTRQIVEPMYYICSILDVDYLH